MTSNGSRSAPNAGSAAAGTYPVTITGATNATLGTATATGTILNDDVAAPPAFSVVSVPVNSPWLLLAAMLGVIAVRRKLS